MLVHQDLTPLRLDHQREAVEALELSLERPAGHQLDGQALSHLEALKEEAILNIDGVLRYSRLARSTSAPARRSKTSDMSSRSVESSHVMPLSFRNQVSCRLA